MIRGAILVMAVGALASSCHLFDRPSRCDGIESEFIPGFTVTGFALGTNGRGYLSGIAAFGDCAGTYEGLLFKVDTTIQSAQPIPISFIPGKVLVASDGEHALLMGLRDASSGLIGGVPNGAAYLDGTTLLPVDLGGTARDIETARGGWVVSAGSGGSWLVAASTGQAVQLIAGESRCGAEAGGKRLLCIGSEIKVIDSSGTLVSSLILPEAPTFVAGGATVGVVVYASSAAVVRAGAIDNTLSLMGIRGADTWISPDSAQALVQTSRGTRWLRLSDGVAGVTGDNLNAIDVAFSSDASLGVIAFGGLGSYGLIDLATGAMGADIAPNNVESFENIGGNVFVLAGGKHANVLRRGDRLPVFQKIQVVAVNDVQRLASWDLTIE